MVRHAEIELKQNLAVLPAEKKGKRLDIKDEKENARKERTTEGGAPKLL